MFIQIRNQKEIISKAVKKAGTYRRLEKIIDIPRSAITGYWAGRAIPENRFNKIIEFVGNRENVQIVKLNKNWKQIKGGTNSVNSRIRKGTFEEQLKKAQKKSSKKLKEWHKKMKKKDPEKYHLLQYERFKKISKYKLKTLNGEKVRNKLEKDIADILYRLKIPYKYEALVKSKGKYFFPDFLINDKIVVECTSWRGEEKAYKLREKISYLKKNYKIYVVVPKTLYTYYKILDNHLIKGLDEFVPVAQTFHSTKN